MSHSSCEPTPLQLGAAPQLATVAILDSALTALLGLLETEYAQPLGPDGPETVLVDRIAEMATDLRRELVHYRRVLIDRQTEGEQHLAWCLDWIKKVHWPSGIPKQEVRC